MEEPNMIKLKSKLSTLLFIQCLLIIAIFWTNYQSDSARQSQPLLSFNKNLVNRITITGSEKSIQLENKNNHWIIAGNEPKLMPVDSKKLNILLDKLLSLKVNWPTSTSTSSHKRFEVTHDSFQKHLQLYSNNSVVGNIYLGTSPGFKKVHVRREGEDEVYSVQINSFDLPVESNEWLNKSLIRAKDITSISGIDYMLIKEQETWKLSQKAIIDTANNSKLNKQKVEELTSTLTSINVEEIANIEIPKESLKIKVASNNILWIYTFFKDKENFYVQRNDIESPFKISENDYNNMTKTNLSSLIAEKTAYKEKDDVAKDVAQNPEIKDSTAKIN